jgi:hypothetical protein
MFARMRSPATIDARFAFPGTHHIMSQNCRSPPKFQRITKFDCRAVVDTA